MRIGITDYAQDALGDVVFVQVPEVGADGRRPGDASARSSPPSRCPTSTRRSRARSSRSTTTLADDAAAGQRGPVRRGLDLRDRAGRPGRARRAARRRGVPGARRGLRDRGVADVFCNNCGHRNPPGSNFCSSCGALLEPGLDDRTTITFHPDRRRGGSRPTRTLTVDLDELPTGVGAAGRAAGPEAGLALPARRADVTTRRPPPRQRHLPRRHHRVAPPRRGRAATATATSCATSAR